jgi:hypothetical protein
MNVRHIAVLALLGLLLPQGGVLAARPAVTLVEDSPLCPAGSAWVDMDDPERHPAALDRALLGPYDANGDGQLCVQLRAAVGAETLRVGYKVSDLGEAKDMVAVASCPDDSGPLDLHKPESMPIPLTHEGLTSYDRNGDGQLCVSRPLLGEGDFTTDVYLVETHNGLTLCGGLLATIIGTTGNDTIVGTQGDDVIAGLSGNDQIAGLGGNDIICGNAGEDKDVTGGEGDDELYGGPDDDVLLGDPAVLSDDELVFFAGEDKLSGGDGNDQLYGFAGNDQLWGGEGDDWLYGQHDSDTLWGGAGNDQLQGGFGDVANDVLYGDDGDDTLSGHEGDDELHGGADDDELQGDDGNDKLFGGEGDDELYGEDGDDELFALGGSDHLDGGASTDECWGALATTTFINCELPDRHR